MAKKVIITKSSAKKRKAAQKKYNKIVVRIAITVLILVFLSFMIIPLFMGTKTI